VDKSAVIRAAVGWLEVNGIEIPGDLAAVLKTYTHFSRQISQAVRDLFNGGDVGDFTGTMAEIISVQLPKAWAAGMDENGLSYPDDMIEEWQLQLDGIILSEYNYVDGFAQAIIDARDNPDALPGLIKRGDLWANRYNDVQNQALMMTAGGKDRMVWILGDSEENCPTCSALNGIVAYSREWEQSRFKTQNPPNGMLECGGWQCHCQLLPTNQRRTRNALDRLIEIAQGA
jgi:hypothetical protein